MSSAIDIRTGTSPVLLEARGLSKSYGGVAALDDVGFDLRTGEVHALVGENGAGKSTFVKILAGLVTPDEGTLTFEGRPFRPGHDATRLAVVHQELSVVPELTVLDNVLLGHPALGWPYRRRRFAEGVRETLAVVGLADVRLDAPASTLSLAEQQLVEIARAVHLDARIMVLDEPTATLTDTEIARVFAAVRRLRDAGRSVIYISHRMREIFDLTDRVTTFRNGRLVATDDTAGLSMRRLVERMIGHEPSTRATEPRDPSAMTGPRLRLEGLAVRGRFEDVSLDIAPGEIVGLVGQLGSGADEVVRALAGMWPAHEGSVHLGDDPVELRSVRSALGAGFAYVSNDRAREGVFLDLSVRESITSSALHRVSRRGRLLVGREHRLAGEIAQRFQLDRRRLPHRASELSGGNQQKVALAKAAAAEPRVFLLNEPTRGVDVGARAEIYGHLRRMAQGGTPIVMFTSDLSEAVDVCDRIVTMFRGRIVRVTDNGDQLQPDLLQDILNPEAVHAT